MFPDVRWLFAAMFASILALSGGFGLFASLRVRHEPLAHLSASAGPPQLFADTTEAPATPAVTPPFESRFPADRDSTAAVAAEPQPPSTDRIETSAPIEPPASRPEVTANVRVPAQPAEVADGAKPLDLAPDSAKPLELTPVIPANETTPASTPEPAPAEVAAIAPADPDTTGTIDPAAVVPLPKAAPPQTSVKAKAPHPRPTAKVAVRQPVAAKTRHARRPRARDGGQATAAAFPGQPFKNSPFQNSPNSPFQNSSFENSPFQSAARAHTTRAQRRAGGGVPMGGPFIPASRIDPY
jgi:hypothetical protein